MRVFAADDRSSRDIQLGRFPSHFTVARGASYMPSCVEKRGSSVPYACHEGYGPSACSTSDGFHGIAVSGKIPHLHMIASGSTLYVDDVVIRECI